MDDRMLPRSGSLGRPMIDIAAARQLLVMSAVPRLLVLCERCANDDDGLISNISPLSKGAGVSNLGSPGIANSQQNRT